ncbi:hypothetical protein [Asticcacaulis sp.]|uniref:hypothetical protein n=1 Tax=Asticcacaulis sp. TaxID=1872648 RepID=UPI0026050209|nr:hypothetical protein [Asticcacaulis sp.]
MLTRRHALSAVASAALVAPVAALTPPDPDTALVALYDRFTALAREMNGDHPGMTPEEEDRHCEAIYEENERNLDALLSAAPTGPAGIAVLALAAIRKSELTSDHRQWLHEWNGYSRPIDPVLDDTNRFLWTIAQWGLRQSGRLPAGA